MVMEGCGLRVVLLQCQRRPNVERCRRKVTILKAAQALSVYVKANLDSTGAMPYIKISHPYCYAYQHYDIDQKCF